LKHSLYICVSTLKNNAMTKEEILELIFNEERELYEDYLYAQQAYGYDDETTKGLGAQWGAISTLKDKIEENENN
jgi:hypothetical protein